MARALITDGERERIRGDRTDKARYEATSRVRSRIRNELVEDVAFLEENHPELLDDLRDVVCEN